MNLGPEHICLFLSIWGDPSCECRVVRALRLGVSIRAPDYWELPPEA